MGSLRKKLLVNLLGLLSVSWLIVMGITFHEAHHEIEEVFDAQLAQATGILSLLIGDHVKGEALQPSELAKKVFGHKYEHNISFQVWHDDELILRSNSAPATRFSGGMGFSDEVIEGERWRVFQTQVQGSPLTYYAAEKYYIRNELITHITIGNIVPLLGAIPLMAFLLWFSVGRSLSSLKAVAGQVSRRSPESLAQIKEKNIPVEISPLIAALNNLLLRLETAFGKERAFASNAAHELRTPLSIIRLHAQVALRSKDPKERADSLEKIIKGVDRNSHLVDQLLALGRLSDQSAAEEFQDVDLVTLSQDVLADINPQAMEKDIRLSLVNHCQSSEETRVRGNSKGLAIMLRNLLDNSIRYSLPKKEVSVSISGNNGTRLLTVTDNGPGIPVKFRDLAFDGFYRGSDRKSEGCGLGLSIVKRIAQLHHAGIKMEDPPSGEGLQVTLSFKASD